MILPLSGCVQTAAPEQPLPGVTTSSPAPEPSVPEPAVAQPSSVPEPLEEELGAHWDEPLDGEPATADSALTNEELLDLLRLPATAPSSDRTCVPDQVEISILYVDAAAGTRFGYLTVENTSTTVCSVEGYPGFGARGQWGQKFLLKAEQRADTDDEGNPLGQVEVILRPGELAQAEMVWTGELAGAHSEPISLFAVQLAQDQEVIGLPVTREVMSDYDEVRVNSGLDISMLTTVRVGLLTAVTGDLFFRG